MKLKIFPVGPLGTNCYFIIDENTKTAAVVDPGYDAAYIHGKLSRLGVTCKDDTSHAWTCRPHRRARRVAQTCRCPGLYPRGRRKHAFRPCAVAGKVYRHGDEQLDPPEHVLSDGDKITLGDTTVEVLHTPGHTPGSVCYLIRGEGKKHHALRRHAFQGEHRPV